MLRLSGLTAIEIISLLAALVISRLNWRIKMKTAWLILLLGSLPCLLTQAPQKPVSLFNGYALMGLSKELLKKTSMATIDFVQKSFQDTGVQKDAKELTADSSNWHYPLEPHVTTKYWGAVMPTEPQDVKEYQSFREGVSTITRFPVVCYAVGGLLAMPAFMDITQTPQSNRFPHTTVVTGSLAAQYSNDLIMNLYDQQPEFAANYDKGFQNPSQTVYKYTVTIKDQPFTSYVVVLPRSLWITGTTRRFYIS